MRLEYQDSIDRYVLGQMTHDERREFEEKVANQDELKEQLFLTQNVRSIIERDERSEILKRIKQRDEENRRSATPNQSIIYWISGIAAVFIAGFFLFNNFFNRDHMIIPGDEDVYRARSQGAIRGDEATIEYLLSEGDYLAVLDRTEKMEIEIETELLMLEREKDARGPEQDKLDYKIYNMKIKQEGCNLLKAQALIGLNRIEEAIDILDELRHSESKYRNQADSLYNLLKKRK